MKEVLFNGKRYKSITDCCKDYDLDYHRVVDYKKSHGISIQDAINYVLENPKRPDEKNYWTAKEEEIVKKMISDGFSVKKIAKLIGRTETAVSYHIHSREGFPEATRRKIDEEGKQRIKAATSNAELSAIAEEYGVALATVYYHRNGGKNYVSKEREAQVRELAKDHTPKEIAKELGVSEGYVRIVARKCGITLAGRPRRDWTEAEEKYLRENYGTVPHMKIAGVLKRDQHVIQRKAKRMGLI